MKRLKPAVHQKWLILISGIMWSGVGIFLMFLASKWVKILAIGEISLIIAIGITLGITIAYFGFSKIAQKNIDRIKGLPEKPCVFAFQQWHSYILIAFMMTLGITMRSSGLIPKPLLAPLYIGIGSALFLSSFLYYRQIR
jgi:membrane-bound metal-dependent hydrolase YbcI (DUF457 family)